MRYVTSQVTAAESARPSTLFKLRVDLLPHEPRQGSGGDYLSGNQGGRMRSVFGWSLPPGVRTLPGEEPCPPCDVCGGDPEGWGEDANGCFCPECPICGATGDPQCYESHGLKRSILQVVMRGNRNELDRLDAAAENRFWEQYAEEDFS
jgi:hypothetical protein